MGKLDGLKCYLAGPVNPAPPGQLTWRETLTPMLADLGIHALDPLRKPIDLELDDSKSRGERHTWKAHGDWDSFSAIMTLIRDVDLAMVRQADFVVGYLDTTIPLCGTYDELLTANALGMPVLVVCPKRRVLDWLFGVLDYRTMFDDLDELIGHLNTIDSLPPATIYHGRWLFMKKSEIDTL